MQLKHLLALDALSIVIYLVLFEYDSITAFLVLLLFSPLLFWLALSTLQGVYGHFVMAKESSNNGTNVNVLKMALSITLSLILFFWFIDNFTFK